jgi:hypothetical protein
LEVVIFGCGGLHFSLQGRGKKVGSGGLFFKSTTAYSGVIFSNHISLRRSSTPQQWQQRKQRQPDNNDNNDNLPGFVIPCPKYSSGYPCAFTKKSEQVLNSLLKQCPLLTVFLF